MATATLLDALLAEGNPSGKALPASLLDEQQPYFASSDSAVVTLSSAPTFAGRVSHPSCIDSANAATGDGVAISFRTAFPLTQPPGAAFYPTDMDKQLEMEKLRFSCLELKMNQVMELQPGVFLEQHSDIPDESDADSVEVKMEMKQKLMDIIARYHESLLKFSRCCFLGSGKHWEEESVADKETSSRDSSSRMSVLELSDSMQLAMDRLDSNVADISQMQTEEGELFERCVMADQRAMEEEIQLLEAMEQCLRQTREYAGSVEDVITFMDLKFQRCRVQVESKTYTEEVMAALKTLRERLVNDIRHIDRMKEEENEKMSKFQEMGPEFEKLVEEYKRHAQELQQMKTAKLVYC
eukprot:TRINITY_DN5022_c0_g2_i1.p1 TRINITY_DN5022_c0_g2~~TRINITY_DN5022_c0_g2_i1.p1  ORF type:complete len:354 (+),score=112.74 TRINITY_DN5022_c0_g2_i1:117-1178(+)